MEILVGVGGFIATILALLLTWLSQTDQLLHRIHDTLTESAVVHCEIRDVLIEIRDTPPVINVIPRKKLDEL